MSDLSQFIALYTDGDKDRIAFAWNGKHADAFEDSNYDFRQAVLDATLANPDAAPLALIRDLFLSETQWSREAWGVDNRVAELASIMLTRGKEALLMDFLIGKSQSFDASMACGGMSIAPQLAADLLREVKIRMNASTDDAERRLLEVGRAVFAERAPPGSEEPGCGTGPARPWWRFW